MASEQTISVGGSMREAMRSAAAGPTWRWWALVASLLVFRLVWAGWASDLHPDEAFYWTWSRHLSGGYLDHPPMVGWLMWLSSRWVGGELGVRLPAVLMMFGTALILVRLARALIPSERGWHYVAWIVLGAPMFVVLATIHLPDTPAIFFSTAAMACAVYATRQKANWSALQAGWWLGFGVCSGLAMLSKYTAVLVPGAVGLVLLLGAEGRRHLCKPWVYLAALTALGVFWPCVAWNRDHHWISFRFQMSHGTGAERPNVAAGTAAPAGPAQPVAQAEAKGSHNPALGLLGFVGGQLLVGSPVLFGLGVVALWHYGRRYRGIALSQRMILASAALPLVLFGVASLLTPGQPNWADFAHYPLALLIVAYVGETWSEQRCKWLRVGCIVALVGTIGVHLVPVAGLLGVPRVDEMYGWGELGRKLDEITGGTPLFCTRHQDAGEAAFYMRGQPDVWRIQIGQVRLSAFDFYPNQPDLIRIDRLWLMTRDSDASAARLLCRQYGLSESQHVPIRMTVCGRERSRHVFLLERAAGGAATTEPGDKP